MEFLLRQIPNAYQIKSNYLIENKDSIQTLLVGSSHVLYGINPDFLTDKALNYGNVSQTIDIDYDIVSQYITELQALSTVVLRWSYTTPFEQLKKGDERWRLKDYAIYTTVHTETKLKYHFEMFSVKLKYNIERLYNYYILKKEIEHTNTSGWSMHMDASKLVNLETLGERIAKKHTAITDNYYTENVNILERIVKMCNKHNINVLLVTMPAYHSYVNKLDTLQLRKTIDAGVNMQQQYENCRYFNLLNDKRFDKQDFIDVDHLNATGAEKFSKLIDSLLTQ
ncbi:hypothetical protein FNB79_00655 [Formosa sediminum]|uniref:SGNH/GDSL hydrolase family protein n=2 Tax=Formosa sediminum TaxID=2594004 RepID=A0A516GM00_9FLAO|nr:hypothetical protein FNB79_00655 [Formosa sediminum]